MVNPWFVLCFCLNNSIEFECIFSWVVLNIDIALRTNALLVNSRKIEVAHIVFTVNSKIWPTEISSFTKYQKIVLTCYSQTLTYSKAKWIWYDMWGFDFAFGHPKALRAVTLEMICRGVSISLILKDPKFSFHPCSGILQIKYHPIIRDFELSAQTVFIQYYLFIWKNPIYTILLAQSIFPVMNTTHTGPKNTTTSIWYPSY